MSYADVIYFLIPTTVGSLLVGDVLLKGVYPVMRFPDGAGQIHVNDVLVVELTVLRIHVVARDTGVAVYPAR